MPQRRSAGRPSRVTEDEINDLILKLQQLLPHHSSTTSTRCNTKVSAAKIMKETCKYLKKLHKEVDDLSERLAQLLSSGATDADTIRTFLLQ